MGNGVLVPCGGGTGCGESGRSLAPAAAHAGLSWGASPSRSETQVLPGHRLLGSGSWRRPEVRAAVARGVGWNTGLLPCPLCQPGQEASPWLLLGGFLLQRQHTAGAGWAEWRKAGQRAVPVCLSGSARRFPTIK